MTEEKKVRKYVTVQSRREEIYEIFGRQANAFEERALAELPLYENGKLKVLNDNSMNGKKIRELLKKSERNRDVSLLNEAGELLFMQAYFMNAYLNPDVIGEEATEAERARFAISNTSYLEKLDPVKTPHSLEEGSIQAKKAKLIPEFTAHPVTLVFRLLDPVRNSYTIDQAVVEAERVKFDVGVTSHPESLLSKLSFLGRNLYGSGQASVEGAGASFIAAGASFSKKYHSASPHFLSPTGSSAFDLDRERGNLEEQNRQGALHLREEIVQREREFNVRQGRDRQQREQPWPAPTITHSPLSENLPNVTLYAQASPPTLELQPPPLNPFAQVHNNSTHYNGWHQLQPEQYYPKTDPQAYSLSSGPADFKNFQMLQYHTSALPMTTTQNNLKAHNVDTLPSITIAKNNANLHFSYQSPGVPSTTHTTLHEFAARHPPPAGASKSHADSNSSQHIGCPLSIPSMSQVHENVPTTAVTMSVRKPLPPRGKSSMSSHYPGDCQSFSTKSQDRMKSTTQPIAQQSLSSAIPLNPPSDLSNALPAGQKRDLGQYAEDRLKEVMKEAEDVTFKKAKTTSIMREAWKAT